MQEIRGCFLYQQMLFGFYKYNIILPLYLKLKTPSALNSSLDYGKQIKIAQQRSHLTVNNDRQ